MLQLPFLLPEDNNSCDIVRGVPGGLSEFCCRCRNAGLCVMTPQSTSSGHWTIYWTLLHAADTSSRKPLRDVANQSTAEFSDSHAGGHSTATNGYPGQNGLAAGWLSHWTAVIKPKQPGHWTERLSCPSHWPGLYGAQRTDETIQTDLSGSEWSDERPWLPTPAASIPECRPRICPRNRRSIQSDSRRTAWACP